MPTMRNHQNWPTKLLSPMTMRVGSGKVDAQAHEQVGEDRHDQLQQCADDYAPR